MFTSYVVAEFYACIESTTKSAPLTLFSMSGSGESCGCGSIRAHLTYLCALSGLFFNEPCKDNAHSSTKSSCVYGRAGGSPLPIVTFLDSLFCVSQVVTCERLWLIPPVPSSPCSHIHDFATLAYRQSYARAEIHRSIDSWFWRSLLGVPSQATVCYDCALDLTTYSQASLP